MEQSITSNSTKKITFKKTEKKQYKQEMHRGVSKFMSFTICFTNAAVIPSLFLQMDFGLRTGGPAAMLYGWIAVGIFNLINGSVMAEICSTYPAAGSVYYWAGVLSPKYYAPLFSYCCGWLNLLGNMAVNASFAFGLANTLSGLAMLRESEQQWHPITIVIVAVIILAIWALKCMMRIDHQGVISDVSGIYQIIFSLIIVVGIFLLSPTLSSTHFVATTYYNDTGYEDGIYVCTIAILVSLYSFVGYEAAATMAEETQNPHMFAPIGMMSTIIVSALMGLFVILGILYGCGENIDYVVHGPSESITNFFMLVSNHHISMTIIMVLVIFSLAFVSGFSGMTVTSRMGYAMSRDKALPFSKYLHYINLSTKNPDRIIIMLFVVESLLCGLPLISTTAFTAITQVSTICIQLSYVIPILLRITSAKDTFVQNQYNLGRFSIVFGWISVVWLLSTSFIMFLPTERLYIDGKIVTNFNYSVVVIGLTIVIATIYWNLPKPYGAKHFFKGPLRPDLDPHYDDEQFITLRQANKSNYDSITFN